MTDRKPTEGIDDFPEINPDGADLDGTAEIERQRGEHDTASSSPIRPTDSAATPPRDDREQPDESH